MKTAIIVNNQYFGHDSDPKLGQDLIGKFFRKLWASDKKPQRILFYNSGVKLLVDGSPALDALDELDKSGVELIACGTCIDFFELKDKIKFGRVSDMGEMVKTMMDYEKVITI